MSGIQPGESLTLSSSSANPPSIIQSPHDPLLEQLTNRLAELAPTLEQPGAWPKEQLDWCGQYGVFQWFMEETWGGQNWSEKQIVEGYLHLSAACLTTTFVITQRMGACRRIAVSDNQALQEKLLPKLIEGTSFATVGISHLTTSRRHLAQPVLTAEEKADGFVLQGYSPWVTGARWAQHIVLGATLPDGRQILMATPTDLPGIEVPEPAQLTALTASQTGAVELNRVFVSREWLLAGPMENVMQQGAGAKTGGLQTSTLAVGLACAAIEFIENQAQKRSDLLPAAERLREDWTRLKSDLLSLAEGKNVCTQEELRAQANSLALRSSQAALAAAKGSGYVVGHLAGRLCRQALFFLVWSCPQPVMAANLCEFAQIEG